MCQSYDFAVEKRFTSVYRNSLSASPVEREIRCLCAMYPELLEPIRPGDLLAGRVRISLIGFGPEPGGLGYYCNAEKIPEALRSGSYTEGERAEIQVLLDFWSTENTTYKVRAAYPPDMARTLPRDDYAQTPMPAAPLYRMAGIYLDYGRLLALGIPGLAALVAEKREAHAQSGGDAALFDGMEEALALLARCCLHYAEQARAMQASAETAEAGAACGDMAFALERIAVDRPRTLREAMQLMWLYTIVSGSLNYGRMDDALGDFLEDDLAAGRLTMDQAQALFNSLWQIMADRKTIWNGRVILGGLGRHNPAAADRVAMLAMEASRVVLEVEPQLSLRVYEGMDPALMDKALSVIQAGRTYPILYNDDVNVPAVMHAFRVGREDAEDYVPFGCGEYVINHRSFGTPNGIINLLKVLDMTLRNGMDGMNGQKLGIETGDVSSFERFEDLWDAYTRQAEHFVRMLARQQLLEYRVVGGIAPFLFLSMLYDDCLDRGRSIFDGGIRYLGGTIETYGNINTADSLTAIREVVYKKKQMTLPQLVAALDADFQGYERERKWLRDAPKYGNDDPVADEMVVRVHEHVCNFVRDRIQDVDLHSYLVVIINNDTNTQWGRLTPASADGRGKGCYMANANNPWSGNDKKGLTAMLNSLVKLRPDLHAGAVQNMKFSPELFKGDGAIVRNVLGTYFDNGGAQAMISVVNRDDLQQAMLHPENYSHLFVRVGGFSARFVELAHDVQLEILNRTLY